MRRIFLLLAWLWVGSALGALPPFTLQNGLTVQSGPSTFLGAVTNAGGLWVIGGPVVSTNFVINTNGFIYWRSDDGSNIINVLNPTFHGTAENILYWGDGSSKIAGDNHNGLDAMAFNLRGRTEGAPNPRLSLLFNETNTVRLGWNIYERKLFYGNDGTGDFTEWMSYTNTADPNSGDLGTNSIFRIGPTNWTVIMRGTNTQITSSNILIGAKAAFVGSSTPQLVLSEGYPLSLGPSSFTFGNNDVVASANNVQFYSAAIFNSDNSTELAGPVTCDDVVNVTGVLTGNGGIVAGSGQHFTGNGSGLTNLPSTAIATGPHIVAVGQKTLSSGTGLVATVWANTTNILTWSYESVSNKLTNPISHTNRVANQDFVLWSSDSADSNIVHWILTKP